MGAHGALHALALPEPNFSRLRTGNTAQSQTGDAIVAGAEPKECHNYYQMISPERDFFRCLSILLFETPP